MTGDLSSFQWVEGDIKPDLQNKDLVKIIYASLNFRDVMLATGKLMPEAIVTERKLNKSLIGFEFSGIDTNGRRVMGFGDRQDYYFKNVLKCLDLVIHLTLLIISSGVYQTSPYHGSLMYGPYQMSGLLRMQQRFLVPT